MAENKCITKVTPQETTDTMIGARVLLEVLL